MAAGSPFSETPNLVETVEPVYNNVETQTESMKKEYFNLSTTPLERFRLTFNVRDDAERDVILDHFNDQLGSFYSFSWQSVPDYVNSGANITGRWVQGSLNMTAISGKWKVTIDFEKANS